MYGLLIHMQTPIGDFVREAGSVRALAEFLGLSDRRGVLRVAQWASRGVIPWNAQVKHAAQWRKLSSRISRKQFPRVPS